MDCGDFVKIYAPYKIPCAGRNTAFMLTVHRICYTIQQFQTKSLHNWIRDWGLVGCAYSKEPQAIRLNACDFTTPGLTLQSCGKSWSIQYLISNYLRP